MRTRDYKQVNHHHLRRGQTHTDLCDACARVSPAAAVVVGTRRARKMHRRRRYTLRKQGNTGHVPQRAKRYGGNDMEERIKTTGNKIKYFTFRGGSWPPRVASMFPPRRELRQRTNFFFYTIVATILQREKYRIFKTKTNYNNIY